MTYSSKEERAQANEFARAEAIYARQQKRSLDRLAEQVRRAVLAVAVPPIPHYKTFKSYLAGTTAITH